MTFSVAIPTYNRPEALVTCLRAVLAQSLLPQEILIIDDGSLDQGLVEAYRNEAERGGVFLTYYKKNQTTERRGLAESKNIALEKATGEIIFFLDDDIVIQTGFLATIMGDWQKRSADSKLIGIGGVIVNNRLVSRCEKIYHQIFGLSSNQAWDVTAVGFQVWNDQLKNVSDGYYAHGGLVSLRRLTARDLGFTVFSGGRTSLEDVDFCFRAKKTGFHFVIQPAAQADHNCSQETREGAYLSGQKESQNRIEIFNQQVQKNFKNRSLFFWSMFGWILRQFLAGHFAKGLGMLRGLIRN